MLPEERRPDAPMIPALPARVEPAYSMHRLLQLLNSDGADSLELRLGSSPVIILQKERFPIEGPALTAFDLEELLHEVADTRQRRVLRETGATHHVYRFRNFTDFIVSARLNEGIVEMEIS